MVGTGGVQTGIKPIGPPPVIAIFGPTRIGDFAVGDGTIGTDPPGLLEICPAPGGGGMAAPGAWDVLL